ncbi:MAG: GAF domain-containing protein [Methanospirillum sp.]|nr:GAF domain-containing protein [Methanospirillum sp.]
MVVNEYILTLFDNGAPRYISVSDPLAEKIRTLLEKEGILSYVLIPLYEHGILVGCLNLGSHTLPEIPVRERPFLEALSGWLGKTLARLIHSRADNSVTGYAVVKSDGSIIEGSLWENLSSAPQEVTGCIRENHAQLITGNEITCVRSAPLPPLLIRFCPWGGEVAFLVRSGESRS